jgi:hypothetical protein
MKVKQMFLIFGGLQALSLAAIIFFLLEGVVGFDTQIVLSVIFPVFTLIVEYMIYSKK